MTTLLEWVIAKYLGSPTRIVGRGESVWPCPQCEHPRFHTMPDKPQFKHRFRCWWCEFRGDVLDFLREQHPDEPFSDRLARLEELRSEFEGQGGKARRVSSGEERGVKLLERLLEDQRIDHEDLLEAVAELNHRRNLQYEFALLGRKKR